MLTPWTASFCHILSILATVLCALPLQVAVSVTLILQDSYVYATFVLYTAA